MRPVRAVRTHVTRRIVDEAVSNHFIFTLEAFSAFGTLAAAHRAVVGSFLGVDVFVGAILGAV